MGERTFEPHEVADLVRAVATSEAGTTLRLAPGRFVLTEPLAITNGISIVGTPGRSVLVGNGAVTLVVLHKGGEHVRISSITFEGGEGLWGGAITCGVSATLTVENCRFKNNSAREDGGAIFLRAAQESRFVRCSFEGNRARRGGGAVDVGTGCDVTLERCLFSDNEAKVGGAVFLEGTGALQIRSCTFADNRATVTPGGAALFVRGAVSSGPSAYVDDSTFGGPDAIAGDPETTFDVFVARSVVPPDLFTQRGFKSVGPSPPSTIFREVDAFLARAYPGARLSTGLPFLDMGSAVYRKLARGKAQVIADELLREACWLVTLADPTPILGTVDAIEQRAAYLEGDYSQKTLPAVQWIAKIRGSVDLEAVRARIGGGFVILIAPASTYVIDQDHLSFFAPSAPELASMVARHPESFLSADYF